MWSVLVLLLSLLTRYPGFDAAADSSTSTKTGNHNMEVSGRLKNTATLADETEKRDGTKAGREYSEKLQRSVNQRCESPASLLSDEEIRSTVLTKLRGLRMNADKMACKFNNIVWNETLKKTAKDLAMRCPLANDTSFEGDEQRGRIISINYKAAKKLEEMVVALRDSALNNTKMINIYQSGRWDPSYQVVWNETRSAGCGFVSFTNSDLEYLRSYFKIEVQRPMKFTALVCDFYPPGCVSGLRVYEICPKEVDFIDWPPKKRTTLRTRAPEGPQPWTKKRRRWRRLTKYSEGVTSKAAFGVAILSLVSIFV